MNSLLSRQGWPRTPDSSVCPSSVCRDCGSTGPPPSSSNTAPSPLAASVVWLCREIARSHQQWHQASDTVPKTGAGRGGGGGAVSTRVRTKCACEHERSHLPLSEPPGSLLLSFLGLTPPHPDPVLDPAASPQCGPVPRSLEQTGWGGGGTPSLASRCRCRAVGGGAGKQWDNELRTSSLPSLPGC